MVQQTLLGLQLRPPPAALKRNALQHNTAHCRELWRLLRPTTAVPDGVQVHKGGGDTAAPTNGHGSETAAPTNGHGGEHAAPAEHAEHKAASVAATTAAAGKKLGKTAMGKLEGSADELEGYGPDLVADQLTHALQVGWASTPWLSQTAAVPLGFWDMLASGKAEQSGVGPRGHRRCVACTWAAATHLLPCLSSLSKQLFFRSCSPAPLPPWCVCTTTRRPTCCWSSMIPPPQNATAGPRRLPPLACGSRPW